MTIEEKIQALLEASLPAYGSPVAELCEADHIRTPGDNQNISRPYVIHFPITPTPSYTHGGLSAMREWTYQVSVFTATYPAGRTLANAIRDTLTGNHDGVKIFWEGGSYQFETDTRIHHFAVTFRVLEAL